MWPVVLQTAQGSSTVATILSMILLESSTAAASGSSLGGLEPGPCPLHFPLDEFRLAVDEPQKDLGRLLRRAPALLPILHRRQRKAEPRSKLLLRELEALPYHLDVDVGDSHTSG